MDWDNWIINFGDNQNTSLIFSSLSTAPFNKKRFKMSIVLAYLGETGIPICSSFRTWNHYFEYKQTADIDALLKALSKQLVLDCSNIFWDVVYWFWHALCVPLHPNIHIDESVLQSTVKSHKTTWPTPLRPNSFQCANRHGEPRA